MEALSFPFPINVHYLVESGEGFGVTVDNLGILNRVIP